MNPRETLQSLHFNAFGTLHFVSTWNLNNRNIPHPEPSALSADPPPANHMAHAEDYAFNASPSPASNITHLGSDVASAAPPTANDAAHSKPNGSLPPANYIVHLGSNATNAGAQMQDANPPPANNNEPAEKVRNDGMKYFEAVCVNADLTLFRSIPKPLQINQEFWIWWSPAVPRAQSKPRT